MNSQCELFTDAELMERICKNGSPECCSDHHLISLTEMHQRLKKSGNQIPLVRGLEYRHKLTDCEKCKHYKGEMP